MARLYSSNEIEKALLKINFRFVSQKGSHAKYKNTSGGIVILPQAKKQIPLGTFNSILKQIGISKEEFEKIL